MSLLAIILIVVAVLLIGLFVGGLVVSRRRVSSSKFADDVAKADQALESARAQDRGWNRQLLEAAARSALHEEHPHEQWHRLDLVLVDDRPGVAEDRAHLVAVGIDKSVRVVLLRDAQGNWASEQVGDPEPR